jgi:hypothetical protein
LNSKPKTLNLRPQTPHPWSCHSGEVSFEPEVGGACVQRGFCRFMKSAEEEEEESWGAGAGV